VWEVWEYWEFLYCPEILFLGNFYILAASVVMGREINDDLAERVRDRKCKNVSW
jgi:hypothetical protein